MSEVVPDKVLEAIEFFELRAPIWALNNAALNLTAAQTTQLTSKTAAARTAYEDRQAKFAAAKAATVVQSESVGDLRAFGGSLIEIIRAFAKATNNPRVFSTAQIPPPSDPTPQPPDNPSDVSFDLLNNGQLAIKWKGKSNGGTTAYIVSRAIQAKESEPFGPYQIVGITGNKAFVDFGIPACTVAAMYSVKASKGEYVTQGSVPAQIRFTPSQAVDPALKLAA